MDHAVPWSEMTRVADDQFKLPEDRFASANKSKGQQEREVPLEKGHYSFGHVFQ